jgi:predicted tellurium resistance membrane protein TerC
VEAAIALVTLSAMEIVLGIDNIVFISILTSRLPLEQQPSARRIGLLLALGMRVLLLFSLSYIMSLEQPIFRISSIAQAVGIPIAAPSEPPAEEEDSSDHNGEAPKGDHKKNDPDGISIKDLILIVGGLFLLAKSVSEIHHKIEPPAHEDSTKIKAASFGSVLFQIALLDIIFSLDSVITAVGMAKDIRIMVAAVIIAIAVMMIFAGYVSAFVERHPTVKMLALSFLLLIGVMLVAEGFGQHIDKGYIYFAMAFSLGVEILNLWVRSKSAARAAKAH